MKYVIKHGIIPVIGLLLSLQLPAQIRFYEFRDDNGLPIKTASEMAATGTPMLRPGWALGTIQYDNGFTLTSAAVNFSVFDNKLFYISQHKLYTTVLPVASFSLTFAYDETDPVSYQFKKGYPAVDKQDTASFYEVLFEGDHLQLLQSYHSVVRDTYTYSISREKRFELEQQFYVYFPKENTIRALKPTPGAIAKALPNYAENIKTWNADHDLHGADKDKLIQLVAYLDKH